MSATKNFVYRSSRADIAIKCTGGASLGNCYSASYWTVTSRHKLTVEKLEGMRKLGVLGFGQEFRILSKCDGTEEAAGHDEVPCSVEDRYTGKVLDEPAINPYSGEPYKPIQESFYIYNCESCCDSGDY